MGQIRYGRLGGTKVLTNATAETITFHPNEIPSQGVLAYHFTLTGTNDDYDSLTRIRVKAGGEAIIDCHETHLAAMVQRLSRSNLDYANGDTVFTVPLYVLDAKDRAERYACGFPRGKSATVEIVKDNTGSAGTIACGWTYTTDPADLLLYPMFISQQMNIASSSGPMDIAITQQGLMRGFSINTTGLSALKLVLGGEQILDLDAAHLPVIQQLMNVDADIDPLFIKLEDPIPIDLNRRNVLTVTTTTGWAGITNELGILTLVPQA